MVGVWGGRGQRGGSKGVIRSRVWLGFRGGGV